MVSAHAHVYVVSAGASTDVQVVEVEEVVVDLSVYVSSTYHVPVHVDV